VAPVRVTFLIDGADFTRPGEDLVIVGSDPALGSWRLDGGTLRLSGASFPRWTATVDLPRGATVEYKAVSVKGSAPLLCETGENHRLVLPNAESLVVHGTFQR
jgi:alpha-amylase